LPRNTVVCKNRTEMEAAPHAKDHSHHREMCDCNRLFTRVFTRVCLRQSANWFTMICFCFFASFFPFSCNRVFLFPPFTPYFYFLFFFKNTSLSLAHMVFQSMREAFVEIMCSSYLYFLSYRRSHSRVHEWFLRYSQRKRVVQPHAVCDSEWSATRRHLVL
jgi:hypothetical protein